MNVVQTSEASSLQRQKQKIRETAAKDEARATELSRDGVDDLYTAADRLEGAADSRASAETLSQESQRLRRNGREQSQRGLERLGDGSDRTAEGFAGTEKGLSQLKGSLADLEGASAVKSAGLDTAKQGLAQQAVENGVQGAALGKFAQLQDKDAKLDDKKASQLESLQTNQGLRQEGLDRQTGQLDSYFLAGQSYAQGTTVKAAGFENVQGAAVHQVQAESLGDAREGQKLTQTFAEADEVRHDQASSDLMLSSLWESLKSKAAALNADYLKRTAASDSQTAEGLSARATDLKAQAGSMLQNARILEQSGQCHVAVGRQMQCSPCTYYQGRCLEQQGLAELREASRLKGQASEVRGEGQRLALQAEELRAGADDTLARGEEFEVKSHGSATRSQLLSTRGKEHGASAEKAAETAASSAAAAAEFHQASEAEKAVAVKLETRGTGLLEAGYELQEKALLQQSEAGDGFTEELGLEAALTEESQATTGAALGTVAKELSFLGRGSRLLHKVGASQAREQDAQATVASGIETIGSGLASSETAQARGVEATKMLEQARELELEGLRLQNRGQKMLLEARPKLAQSARLSAESFSASQAAERQEEEAAALITSGNEKIAAAGILREKAAAYKKIAQ